MPYINVKTNAKLSAKAKANIQSRLFDCIGVIPGKSDRYLMIAVEDGVAMAFHRDSESPMAMVEVKIFGEASKGDYQKLTGAITLILADEAKVEKDYCYVKFDEVKYWGYNGFMF